MVHFLVHGKNDNVAVTVQNVRAGTGGLCRNMETGEETRVDAAMDIPLGHKVALAPFSVDDGIIKYNHDIGRVVAPIKAGEHVHVHNVKTRRW